MNAHAEIHTHRTAARIHWFMGILWAVIVAKCLVVTWAVGHWHMPFSAAWVVVPTLVFAALATGLWVGLRE